MLKIILALCLILAVATVEAVYDSKEVHTDAYLKLNRKIHNYTIDEFNDEIRKLEDEYLESQDPIKLNRDFLAESVKETGENFNALELVNNRYKECVKQHRNRTQFAENMVEKMSKCLGEEYEIQAYILNLYIIRDKLIEYYSHQFESNIAKCNNDALTSEEVYSCFTRAVSAANNETLVQKEAFEYELDAVKCTVEVKIKRKSDCAYKVLSNAASEIASAKLGFDNCISFEPMCLPCEHQCRHYGPIHSLELRDKFIANPFYNRTDFPECIQMSINTQYIPNVSQ